MYTRTVTHSHEESSRFIPLEDDAAKPQDRQAQSISLHRPPFHDGGDKDIDDDNDTSPAVLDSRKNPCEERDVVGENSRICR